MVCLIQNMGIMGSAYFEKCILKLNLTVLGLVFAFEVMRMTWHGSALFSPVLSSNISSPILLRSLVSNEIPPRK